jgi:hypothetical protein
MNTLLERSATSVIGLLVVAAALLAGSPVHAQVVLNSDSMLTAVTVNSAGCQCLDATTSLPADGTQTLCTLSMSIPVNVEGPGGQLFLIRYSAMQSMNGMMASTHGFQ